MPTAVDISGNTPGGNIPEPHLGKPYGVPALRPTTTYSGTLSGTSTNVGPFSPFTKYLRIAAPTGQPMYYDVGITPTAAAGENLLPAGAVEVIEIQYPQKLAVLQAGTAGTYTVTEVR